MPASYYSQSLLMHGLSSQHLAGLLDNAPAKQGKRLYGSALTVASVESSAAQLLAGTVVVHGGGHTAAILAGLAAANPRLTLLDAAAFGSSCQ